MISSPLRATQQAIPPRTSVRGWVGGQALVLVMGVFLLTGYASADPPAVDLTEQSLPLRTALHHDPTLGTPLKALVTLYRSQNNIEELVTLYRVHLQQWPQDVRARLVFTRILAEAKDPAALTEARLVVQQAPQYAFAHYLLYQQLASGTAPQRLEAMESLAQAIALDEPGTYRSQWVRELLPLASLLGRHEVLSSHLDLLAQTQGGSPQGTAEVAKLMLSYGRPDAALTMLDTALEASPEPETMVELGLLAAEAQVASGDRVAAERRLAQLLNRVTADYWRRPEILKRRVAVLDNEQARAALITEAQARRDARPNDPQPALELAELLVAMEQPREAIVVLEKASQDIPGSAQLEQKLFETFDLLRDERGRLAYLDRRLASQPKSVALLKRRASTLMGLGRSQEALEQIDAITAELPDDIALTYTIESARLARSTSLLTAAGGLMERALDRAPDRLDLRRELAEIYLALNRRRDAHRLFSEPPTLDTPVENLLGAVSFMIEQNMLSAAQEALTARVAQEKADLELRRRLLEVYRLRGALADGQSLITSSRALADTTPRYRSWLDAAAAFTDNFDLAEDWLATEAQRLQEEGQGMPFDGKRAERLVAFAQVAKEHRSRDLATELLESALEEKPEEALDLSLRLVLLDVTATRGASPEAAAKQVELLSALRDRHPGRSAEADAQLALLYARTQQPHLAQPLIAALDPDAVQELELLVRLMPLMKEYAPPEALLRAMQRRVQLAPTDLAGWEALLGQLAAQQDESGLRLSVRRVLAGLDRVELSQETQGILQQHLVASYWRSISASLRTDQSSQEMTAAGQGNTETLLRLLDEVQRTVQSEQEALWATWCRAYVLARAGRDDASRDALEELQRLAQQVAVAARPPVGTQPADSPSAPVSPDGEGLWIAFPDGMSIPFNQARRKITDPTPTDKVTHDPQHGPAASENGLVMRWRFQTPGGEAWSHLWVEKQTILALDRSGTLHRVDLNTGKQLQAPIDLAGDSISTTGAGLNVVLMQPGAMAIADQTTVRWLDLATGQPRWEAMMNANNASEGPALVLCVRGEDLLVYDVAAETLTTLDPQNGKVIAEQSLSELLPPQNNATASAPINWLTSGATIVGNRLVVFGHRAFIYRLDTDTLEWVFDPQDDPRFPVKLKTAEDANGEGAKTKNAVQTAQPNVLMGSVPNPRHSRMHATPYSMPGMHSASYASSIYLGGGFRPGPSVPPQSPVSSSPVLTWASQNGGLRTVLPDPRHLVLMSGNQIITPNLDFPVTSPATSAVGTPAGVTGRTLVLVQAGALQLVDLQTRETVAVPLIVEDPDNAQSPRGGMCTAVFDGPLVYGISPHGVVCVNAATGREMWRQRWDDQQAEHFGISDANINEWVYTMHGTQHRELQETRMAPVIARATQGVLLLSPEPGVLIALEASQPLTAEDSDASEVSP